MAIPFREKLDTIIKLMVKPKELSALISLRYSGYLKDVGWFNSFKLGQAVDNNIQPIPWFTYPAIEFIAKRLNKNMSVFEFGSGNSTLFFAKRVNSIISVEHNSEWFAKIKTLIPINSTLIYVESNNSDQYLEPLKVRNEKSDIIIVDGIFRNECLIASVNHLTEFGIIILDDSERNEYNKGINYISSNNFKRIDFNGIAPGLLYSKTTTIFYKSDNCLNI